MNTERLLPHDPSAREDRLVPHSVPVLTFAVKDWRECASQHDLSRLLAAASNHEQCQRALSKAGSNIVRAVLRGQGEFVEYDHDPADDVFDDESKAQHYFHARRALQTEHGHLHTFMRTPAMAASVSRQQYPGAAVRPKGDDAIAHLVAIAMDIWGWPTGLFVTNRWVGGEAWYSGEELAALPPSFSIDHTFPSWATNRALTAIVALFRPQIEHLLLHRDAVIAQWANRFPEVDVFEDRALESPASIYIHVDAQISAVCAQTRKRHAERTSTLVADYGLYLPQCHTTNRPNTSALVEQQGVGRSLRT